MLEKRRLKEEEKERIRLEDAKFERSINLPGSPQRSKHPST